MKLEEYLVAEDISLAVFAERTKLSAEGLRLIMKGKRFPRPGTRQIITDATGGKVTLADFVAQAA